MEMEHNREMALDTKSPLHYTAMLNIFSTCLKFRQLQRVVCHTARSNDQIWRKTLLRKIKHWLLPGIFTARRSYASAVLGVVFCPSACRSVCHKKGQSLQFSVAKNGWWAMPLPSEILAQNDPLQKRRLRQISTYNVSNVRDSENSSIMTNRKTTTGFPASYRWSAYVNPVPQRVAQRAIFKIIIQFQSNKVW